MARLPRLYAPMVVQHVLQRRVDDRPLFIDDDTYRLFAELLGDAVREQGVALHAYVLTPNEIRMLATPSGAGAIARVLQSVGRRYVPAINRRTGLRGPLWGQRYRSTLIDADTYLLDSMRFIETRPVVQGLVTSPDQWRWSSHAHHVGQSQQAIVSDHARYWGLSDTPFERQAIYRRLADEPIEAAVAQKIAESVERGWLLGDAAFAARIEAQLNRRGSPLPRGRPHSKTSVPI